MRLVSFLLVETCELLQLAFFTLLSSLLFKAAERTGLGAGGGGEGATECSLVSCLHRENVFKKDMAKYGSTENLISG